MGKGRLTKIGASSAGRLCLTAASALALSGCYSFRGPEPLWGSTGLSAKASYGYRAGPLFERVRVTALAASGCQSVSGENSAAPVACGAPGNAAQQRQFMAAAYTMIYADCNDYFAHMGRRQSASRIIRSSIAPLTTLLTGLLTLSNFKNGTDEKHLLTLLTLGANAGTSGLDIFDENFLFGANNIDAVTKALVEHAKETLKKRQPTFDQAVINVLDNESICRPPQIMRLTREAIANGNITPITTGKPNQPENNPPPAPTTPEESATGNQEAPLESTSVSVPPQ
jgi:hypothetical protein